MPGSMRLSDADSMFLFGKPVAQVEREDRWTLLLPRAFKRVIEDSGAGGHLRKIGVNPDYFPETGVAVSAAPDKLQGLAEGGAALDLVGFMLAMFADRKAEDGRFEKATDRWRKTPDRVAGYVPADAGSIRWTLMSREVTEPFDYASRSHGEGQARTTSAIGAAYAYLSVPFFVPSAVALDAVTAVPPSVAQRREIGLPSRYAMVFHDGIPLRVVAGDEDMIERYAARNEVLREDALLIGAVIAASDDLSVDEGLAFLLLASRDRNGRYAWRPMPVPLSAKSKAAEVVWNYAALLAWEDWTVPPPVPGARGKKGSRGHLRAVARSPEGLQGAFHGVRVLDYRPPSSAALDDADAHEVGSGRELKYQHERRAHRRRVRVGVRDADDRLVGPVFGPEAVEGETFVRVPRLIPRKTVREDLPKRPEPEKVYRVPGGARHADK